MPLGPGEGQEELDRVRAEHSQDSVSCFLSRELLYLQGSVVSFGNAISKSVSRNFLCLQTTLLVLSRLKFFLR